VSFGYGGGRYNEAFNNGTSLWYFRKNNQIDFDAAYSNNQMNTILSDWLTGHGLKDIQDILTNYLSTHYWLEY